MLPAAPNAPADPFAIWRLGVPLDAALLRFNPPEGVSRFQGSGSKWEHFAAGLGRFAESLKRDVPEADRKRAEQEAHAHFAAGHAATDARRELENFIVGHLVAGNLLAVGFRVPRSPADAPFQIPLDTWEGKINWADSTVAGNGLHFVAVRILPRTWLRRTLIENDAAATAQPTPKPIGRPEKKAVVPKAFENLLASGRIDLSKPKSHCYPQIRDFLATQFPDRAGEYRAMSRYTISRGIGDLFERAKLARRSK
jgi:hypothetical protein